MTTPLPRTLTTIVAALLLPAGLPSEAHTVGGSTPAGGTIASDTTGTAVGGPYEVTCP